MNLKTTAAAAAAIGLSANRVRELALSGRLKGEQLRFMLAALVLLVCLRIGWDLMVRPTEIYSIGPLIGGGI